MHPDVSGFRGPLVHLDVSTQQGPPSCTWTCLDKRETVLTLDLSTPQGSQLGHPKVSGKQEPVLVWTLQPTGD